ncbi:MAG: STAS domain-containing protein [Actinomycetota bacterium]
MAIEIAGAVMRVKGASAIIDLSGDINAAAEASLSAAYEQASGSGSGTVVLNFAGVNYMNSTGIALVVGLLAKARQEQRTVKACGLSDHYRHIFEITRLADFMPMFDREDDALV